MNKTLLKINSILFSFFLFFSPATAQNALNPPEIEKYLTSLPLIHTLIQKNDLKNDTETEDSYSLSNISHTPITDSLELAKRQSTFPEFVRMLNSIGFQSPEEWAGVGDKIMMAYTAYQLKNGPNIEEIKKDLQENLAKVKGNQFISIKQKELIINNIQNSMALISDPNYIDNENISIIRPYIDRLNSLLKEHQ